MKFDFAKNRTVEDMSGVPDNCRAFYEKADGDDGFNLKTDTVTTAAVAVITGQNKALKAVRQEVTDAKAAKGIDLSPLETYGKTVTEIVANVGAKVEELTAAASGKESDIATRIAGIKKEHGEATAAAKATHDKELSIKQTKLEAYMLNTEIMNAGTGWTGLNAKLIAPFAKSQMKVADVDDMAQVVVVDGSGEVRYSTSPDRAGLLMNTEELLIEMSETKDYRQLFPSDQASQGGGAVQSANPGVRRGDKTANMNPAQKISVGLKNRK